METVNSKKLIKQYKVTCLGCGNLSFRPYVDFQELKEKKANETVMNKTGKAGRTALVITGTSMACLPLGCCVASDVARQKYIQGLTVEQQIKNYCEASYCKKCNSVALSIEVTEDYV